MTTDAAATPPGATGTGTAGTGTTGAPAESGTTLLTGAPPPAQGAENERGAAPADAQPGTGEQPHGNDGGQAEAAPE